MKECARATCEHDGEQSAKPIPSEVLNVEGRWGDLEAREENKVWKMQQTQGMEVWDASVTTDADETIWSVESSISQKGCCFKQKQDLEVTKLSWEKKGKL